MPRQIGWSTEANLLYGLSQQLDKLICVTGCGPGATGKKYHGSFYDTTTQTVVSGGIAAMKYNTTDISYGVSITNDGSGFPTNITIANAGVYNIQFSAQLQRTSGGNAKTINIWLRKNGTNVPDSNTNVVVLANSTYLVAAWNFFASAAAGDKFQIMWSQNDNIQILYELPDLVLPHPATPSVILTVNQVN